MNGRADGRIDDGAGRRAGGRTDERASGLASGRTHGRAGGRINGRTDGRTGGIVGGRTDERPGGWTDRRTVEHVELNAAISAPAQTLKVVNPRAIPVFPHPGRKPQVANRHVRTMARRMSKLSADMLPSEKVAELVRAYGRGTTRILLEECGVGHMNRSIRWKYVHSRLRMILEVDGFSSFRYKYAIAVEPQDSNLLASTKRTQDEVADSGGRLAMVDKQPKYGYLTKNHLLLALLVLKDGRIAKDHDPESLWTTPV